MVQLFSLQQTHQDPGSAPTNHPTWKGVLRLESSHSRGSDKEAGVGRLVLAPLDVGREPRRKELALRMEARMNEGLPPCRKQPHPACSRHVVRGY
jgi:hypothetical protein